MKEFRRKYFRLGYWLLCPLMHLVMMKNVKYGTQNHESQVD
ncbi:MAG: DUF2933 domain-containing protein [Euryarchaeota archaeon]|nr:DUF2933 domain-containing protein [Euryarchaeota archaeon]